MTFKKDYTLLQQYAEKGIEATNRLANGEKITAICRDYGFNRAGFTRFLQKEHGYVAVPQAVVHKPIEEYMVKYAYREYKKGEKTVSEIARKFGIDRKLLSKALKEKYDVKILKDGRKQLIENYFESIDTPEKSYWLGFLYADGYNNGKTIELALQNSDKHHIELFKKAVGSKHTIGLKRIKTQSGRIALCWRISFVSNQMAADLERHGCGNNKSGIITLPDLSEVLMKYFLRGYFDGDGSITIQKNRYCRAEISSGSIDMLTQTGELLTTLIPGFVFAIDKDKRSLSNYRLRTTSSIAGKNFLKYIYDNAEKCVRLERKYQCFINYNCRPETKPQKSLDHESGIKRGSRKAC